MTVVDYGYLLVLIVVGFACLFGIFIDAVLAKRRKHAQKLGESGKAKPERKY